MSPIEKAARALCKLSGDNPDASVMPSGFQASVRREPRRPDEGPFRWERFIPQARAVLTAIREPSDAMLEAAQMAHRPETTYRMAWQAMVDAAIEEG